MDRRDLLKLFGVGSTVIPIIGTTAATESAARIIEPPKVEPISFAHRPNGQKVIRDMFLSGDRVGTTIEFRSPKHGNVRMRPETISSFLNFSGYIDDMAYGFPPQNGGSITITFRIDGAPVLS